MSKAQNVDQYIAGFPTETQLLLKQVRETIQGYHADLQETISYQIPAYKLNGKVVIYFAGFKNHISIYPVPRQIEAFQELLKPYKGGKGTAQFPIQSPIPFALIKKILAYRLSLV